MKKLFSDGRTFFDGAMGTLLQAAGLKPGEIPEYYNIEKPDLLYDIHSQFLKAGCDVITTNTFGLSTVKLPGPKYPIPDIAKAAVFNAQRAINDSNAANGRDALVAFSLGPCGKLLRPSGDIDFEDVVAAYIPAVRAADEAGADFFQIETMSDLYEMKAIILSVKENSSLPFCVSVTLDERGRLLTGSDIKGAVALAEGMGASAVGINCGFGPKILKRFVGELIDAASVPVIVYPNAGLPMEKDGKIIYELDPEGFANEMKEIASAGVQILGGCCGTTPEHIHKMIMTCRDIPYAPVTDKKHTVICSYAKSVEIGSGKSIIIGEKINPTGNKVLASALKNGELEELYEIGISQAASGADVNDINVGLPEIDELAVMRDAMCGLQAVSDLPLVIDTTKPDVLENALRLYNGKAIINSVNGKKESYEKIFPLAAKYGAAVIGLALDDDGIPKTAKGRLKVAEKIVSIANSYGIGAKDVIIDPLTLTVSVDKNAGELTLQSLRLIKDKLGVSTVLGVSNISFGLPGRAALNGAFYRYALSSGLDAGIIDPFSDKMRAAYDEISRSGATKEAEAAGRKAYNEALDLAFSDAASATENAAPLKEGKRMEMTLSQAIITGLKKPAGELAEKMLNHTPPQQVIDNHIIPALNITGERYEKGKAFLPQLLMSAEAANAAFDNVKKVIAQNADKKETVSGGSIVLATVYGDIHDIGKNIVKVLLESNGFTVIDLGRDVPPEKIMEAAQDPAVKIVGLSALMTTTVPYMAQTIKLLRESGIECRTVVGGAVLNKDYAEDIGADMYAHDATDTVKYARNIIK